MVIGNTAQVPSDTAIDPSSVDFQFIELLAAERIARDQWTRQQLLCYQQQQLPDMLRYSIARSPYYRETIGSQVARGARLEDLPVLTKRTLMSEFDRILTDSRVRLADIERHLASDRAGDLLFGEYRACATGGTSGERGVVVYDRQGWASILANAIRFRGMYRATKVGRSIGIVAPSPLHLSNRVSFALRFGANDVPHLTVRTPLLQTVDALNAYQPEYIVTYPSFVRRLAEEQQAGRLRIAPKKFKTCAETLTEDVRMLCRTTWGVDALNSYGTTEGGLMGDECHHAAGMHLTEDTAVFEVVDEANDPVPPGGQGKQAAADDADEPRASLDKVRDLRPSHRVRRDLRLRAAVQAHRRHGGPTRGGVAAAGPWRRLCQYTCRPIVVPLDPHRRHPAVSGRPAGRWPVYSHLDQG